MYPVDFPISDKVLLANAQLVLISIFMIWVLILYRMTLWLVAFLTVNVYGHKKKIGVPKPMSQLSVT